MQKSSAFFAYLTERENIRQRRLAGIKWPWTDDPILCEWKFTNVKREHDATSMALIEDFYEPLYSPSKVGVTILNQCEILMNCALFRYFGTIEFARAVGWQPIEDFDFERIIHTGIQRLKHKQKTFTSAYFTTNAGFYGEKPKVITGIISQRFV